MNKRVCVPGAGDASAAPTDELNTTSVSIALAGSVHRSVPRTKFTKQSVQPKFSVTHSPIYNKVPCPYR
ncbi:hypothetical protein RR46_13528 [Papilio xuthus]|uniref:Uncharacterized protein n=1 Tax=Papilio xuthus TaxID=66420 RepID=A0A194PG81_PAPXU|nr:hypothetical protein RR46_13528 [Papilio xuthus]